MLINELLDSSPSAKAWDKWGSAVFCLYAHGIAWGLFLAILVYAVPRAEAIFADFGIPLPRQTSFLFRASHRAFALVAVLWVLMYVDWLMIKALSRRGKVTLSQAWPALMLIAPLLLIVWTLVVLVLPFLTIMPRLSG